MMNAADSIAPAATSHTESRCTPRGSTFQPKTHKPEEGRLQEERGQPLHRERGAEHVTDEHRVLRPVHAELELLHEAGHDPDRDVDQQERAEELRQALVARVVRAEPRGLQQGDEERETDRDRDEEEVVDAGRRELESSQIHQIHDNGPFRSVQPGSASR